MPGSHLSRTPVVNGVAGHWVPPLTPDFARARPHVIEQRHHRRPDLLAHELYGDAGMWWVFALYNRNEIRDPIWDFEHGTEILVPDRSAVGG